jgi:hypothetical protein
MIYTYAVYRMDVILYLLSIVLMHNLLPLAFAQTAIAVNASRSVALVVRTMECFPRMFLRVDEEPFSMHVYELIFHKERRSHKRVKNVI